MEILVGVNHHGDSIITDLVPKSMLRPAQSVLKPPTYVMSRLTTTQNLV